MESSSRTLFSVDELKRLNEPFTSSFISRRWSQPSSATVCTPRPAAAFEDSRLAEVSGGSQRRAGQNCSEFSENPCFTGASPPFSILMAAPMPRMNSMGSKSARLSSAMSARVISAEQRQA